MTSITAVSAGLSSPSASRLLADRLISATERALAARSVPASSTIVELRDHARDITNALLTGVPSASLSAAISAVTDASGLIVVTPVFNGSYSGLFKTFFDILDPDAMAALAGQPVLIGATGNSPRHSLVIEHAIRPLFSYLRSVVVPTGVYAASQDWGANSSADSANSANSGDSGADSGDSGAGALNARIARAAGELADLIAARPASPPPAPYADVPPFESLLRG
jgi:FMN reductase